MKSNPKILIIEDDKFILKAMTYKFDESGFKVTAFRSAEEGLAHLTKDIPDLIILDILLPGIDGYAFLRTIKDNDLWKKIPVIIASNLTEDDEFNTEASEYIVKSDMDLEELVIRVKSHIK